MTTGTYIRAITLAVAACLGTGIVAGQTIDSNKPLDSIYDKAKDETIVFVSSMMTVAEEAGLEAYVINEGQTRRLPANITKMVFYFRTPGKSKRVPPALTMALNFGSFSNFRFAQHRKLLITTGQENLNLGDMLLTERKSVGHDAFGPRFWETLEIPLDIGLYKQIINSKNVSMQVGDSRLSLTEAQLKQLRSLADKHLK
jgi:hypothetical protein